MGIKQKNMIERKMSFGKLNSLKARYPQEEEAAVDETDKFNS